MSQPIAETQTASASQMEIENQSEDVSQTFSETQIPPASTDPRTELRARLREGGLKCFKGCSRDACDIHHLDGNHANNDAANLTAICKICHNEIHGISPQMDELGALIRTYWGLQKFKLGLDNQTRAYLAINYPIENFVAIAKKLETDLKEIEKTIAKEAKTHEMYASAMRIKGLGPILFTGLVSVIGDPERFDTASALWKFMGLAVDNGVAEKRKRGQKLGFSLQNRVLCWKIGDSFNKCRNRSVTGKLLAQFHQFYKERDGATLSKGHVLNRAKRKSVKVFLACFWAEWLRVRGKEAKSLYVEKLGHKHIYNWNDLCDIQ